MKSRTAVVIAMFLLQPFNDVLAEGEQEEPSRWEGWKSHFNLGSQT